MGKPAARLGDMGSGHRCHCPPSEAIEGSSDIFINGLPAVRVGDAYALHACPIHGGAHKRHLASGAPTVFFNGKAAGRIGDRIDCGGVHITGSGNVFIGEDSFSGTHLPFREKCPLIKG